jgi:glyceraldehyde-3-phosphate dehydrogenase/erythrose-4-phosphate dehydrogenase
MTATSRRFTLNVAREVLISAPPQTLIALSSTASITRDLTPMDRMVSNGSCTNCLAPLVKTLNDAVALNAAL